MKKHPKRKYYKILPLDYELTPQKLRVIYLEDGNLLCKWSPRSYHVYVRLCTHNFQKDEVSRFTKIIRELIGINDAELIKVLKEHGKYWYIRIKGEDIIAFFNTIGWISPVRCFDYKFQL